jgi:LacI family transcriptional regulator, galactose operon repressor
MAIGTLEAAKERAISVPDQLSIVGFDDAPAAHLTAPPLTTVAQPHERKGELAAGLLLPAIEKGSRSGNGERTVLPTELVIRGSTAPPPRHAPSRKR